MVGKIRRMIVQNSFPDARMRVSRLSMGPPVPYPVSFRLIGPDIAELRRLVLPMREIMERSEEHTSELQSLMRNSYAVFCLKKTNNNEVQCSIVHQTITKE